MPRARQRGLREWFMKAGLAVFMNRAPVGVGIDAVNADTQDLGVGLPEAWKQSFHFGDLSSSRRCPVQRVEQQHHVPLPVELIQANLAAQVVRQGEAGCFVSNLYHYCSPEVTRNESGVG